ncbi:hypothetical protein ACFTSE_26375 [Bacillus cereus]
MSESAANGVFFTFIKVPYSNKLMDEITRDYYFITGDMPEE